MNKSQKVSIYTEFTPNPNSLKFNTNHQFLEKGSVFFESLQAAEKSSPLAKELFRIPHVSSVFIGQNFVTITRSSTAENWGSIIPGVTAVLESFFEGSAKVVLNDLTLSQGSQGSTDIEKKIVQILDSHIRPSIARDGGDITFHGFNNGTVTLHLKGACSTCPSSIATLKAGVERMLREYVPEVREVVQLNA